MKKQISLKKVARFSPAEIINPYMEMYMSFLRELEQYGKRYEGYPATPKKLTPSELFDETGSDTHRYMLIIDNEPAGLLTIGVGDNCHPDADFFIQDFYIAPEFRKSGNGTKMMNLFAKDHRGTYCMVIIKGNTPAENFWNNYAEYGSGARKVTDISWQTRNYLSVFAFHISPSVRADNN